MNYFVFDDIDTRDYSGIYVSFSNVDKTPKRVYDVVNIPARNGAFYIDKQRFEDVEHSYYVIALTKAIGSQFINDLASKVGHHRLEDSFNTDEFYSAVFTSGADIKITSQRDKNTFKVTFTRKPQRWLTSGETATAVANNGTISNPTLFDAKPILQFQGYGDIGIGGKTISVASIPIGNVLLANSKNVTVPYPETNLSEFKEVARHTIDSSLLNTGDDIYVDTTTFVYDYQISGRFNTRVTSFTITSESGSGATSTAIIRDAHTASLITSFVPTTFQKGTASTITHSIIYTMDTVDNLGGHRTYTDFPLDISLAYDGANTITISADTDPSDNQRTITGTANLGNANAYSTKQISGTITVDLDIGEAYWLNNNVPTDANFAVSMGAELPVLSPGSNTITYDNTITNFKIIPNWWKV